MNRIEMVLKQHGPMLSGQLYEYLANQYHMSNVAARKALSRSQEPVLKNRKFPFPNNQVFVYLDSQRRTYNYRKKLYSSLKSKSASVSRIILALENSGGKISKNMLSIYSGLPIAPLDGHIAFQDLIKMLVSEGIILQDNDNYKLSYEYSHFRIDEGVFNSNDVLCQIVSSDFAEWSKKLGLVSYRAVSSYPVSARLSSFNWFLSGPSYVYPLFVNNKNGFIVADVLLKENADKRDVSYFVSKVSIIRNSNSNCIFAPILLVNRVSEDAFYYLKEHNIMIFALKDLFDESYAESLFEIRHVLNNALFIIQNNPEAIDRLLERIRKIENGSINNLRGALFECMVGHLFYKIGVNNLRMNTKVISSNGKEYEMDVLFHKDNICRVIECKAYKSPVDEKYIDSWLRERIPSYIEWIRKYDPNHKIKFELWSLGGYTAEAKTRLEALNHKYKKCVIDYWDYGQIYDFADELGETVFKKQLKEFFKDYSNPKEYK